MGNAESDREFANAKKSFANYQAGYGKMVDSIIEGMGTSGLPTESIQEFKDMMGGLITPSTDEVEKGNGGGGGGAGGGGQNGTQLITFKHTGDPEKDKKELERVTDLINKNNSKIKKYK